MILVLRQRLTGRLHRVGGHLRRGRMRLASRLVSLAFVLNIWVGDLGFWVEPMLARRPGRTANPWPGIIVVMLLILGLTFVGLGADWVVCAALPHREAQP